MAGVPLDVLAMLGLQDPMQLAQMMAQQNISPEMLGASLEGFSKSNLGAMSQPQQDTTQGRPLQVASAASGMRDFGNQIPAAGPQFQSQDNMDIPPEMASPEMQGGNAASMVQPIGYREDLTPDQVYGRFMNTIQEHIKNPYALGAIAATGMHESGYEPNNAFGTWSDPSGSGQPGTSGGIMSWRNERLNALNSYAGANSPADIAPEVQANFFIQENPQLIEALNGAKTAEEAQRIMNNAWAFQGYNEPGNVEATARINTATKLSSEFGGNGVDPNYNVGSTIDFARAEKDDQARKAARSNSEATAAGASGQVGETQVAEVQQQAKSLSEKLDALAKVGKGLKIPDARPAERPPSVSGAGSMGGAGYNPKSMEELFMLLGGTGGGGASVPPLSQLIKGVG